MVNGDSDSSPASDEAVRWLARRLNATQWTERDESALRAWRQASPENEREYAKAEATLAEMSRPEAFGRHAIAEVLRGASEATNHGWSRRRFVGVSVAGATIVLVGLFFALKTRSWEQQYATGVAQRREVELPDGSRVHLDAHTSLSCRFDRDGRNVELVSGRATFLVTPNPARPFEVRVKDRVIHVVGTFFEVGLEPSAKSSESAIVRVAVESGIVSLRLVDMAGDVTENLQLAAGKQAICPSGNTLPQVSTLQSGAFATWRDGRLRYRDESLAVIVRDLQQYFPGRIELADPSLAELRVTGTFHSDDPVAACDTLQDILPVSVRHPSAGHIVIARNSPH